MVGLVILILVPVVIYHFLFSAPGGGIGVERIVVNLDTSEQELIPKLKEQGYIRNQLAFNFVLKIKGWQGRIKPGSYMVSKNMDAWTLADNLVRFSYEKWVVVPEGLRKEEVAEIIQEKLGWSDEIKEEFLGASREGYIFPDTYLLRIANFDDAGKAAAQRMESQFNEKTADLFKEAEKYRIRNDTLIVLASLVQREAGNETEMPLIAGVIWNRWLNNMRFEIDATVQYALGEPGNWWKNVSLQDYKVDSPYNTYLYKGRPPAPICNPGLAAISAVINSEENGYFYYLHDSEGQIHLAETYEEHLANIQKYLRGSSNEE